MTNKELLTAILEKAKAGGYYYGPEGTYMGNPPRLEVKAHYESLPGFVVVTDFGGDSPVSVEEIIFSHKFAKAFFGEEFINEGGEELGCIDLFQGDSWQYHIQRLVLEETEEDKIKYLAKFL